METTTKTKVVEIMGAPLQVCECDPGEQGTYPNFPAPNDWDDVIDCSCKPDSGAWVPFYRATRAIYGSPCGKYVAKIDDPQSGAYQNGKEWQKFLDHKDSPLLAKCFSYEDFGSFSVLVQERLTGPQPQKEDFTDQQLENIWREINYMDISMNDIANFRGELIPELAEYQFMYDSEGNIRLHDYGR